MSYQQGQGKSDRAMVNDPHLCGGEKHEGDADYSLQSVLRDKDGDREAGSRGLNAIAKCSRVFTPTRYTANLKNIIITKIGSPPQRRALWLRTGRGYHIFSMESFGISSRE